MIGRLIAVVGASGVGKDSLIDALAQSRPGLHRVRRTVTRPPGPGERFDSVDADEFACRRDAGAFCLWWQAHGLAYGIPAGVLGLVRSGREAVANLSRKALPEAASRFPRLSVIHLTAEPRTLAVRLGLRGREDAIAMAERLRGAAEGLPEGLRGPVATIPNDGPFEETLAAALAVLYPEMVP